jgi:O-acetyl-ADP-ribose deacetylase (regulator of RNase III)
MPAITVERGDITRARVGAIVNAANEWMLGGGGVDGAIHRAAGRELLTACRAVPEVRPGVRCPTGEARITPGFLLPASWVIHAVGPRWSGSPEDARLLGSAFRSALELAVAHDVRTVALPAISCGVYGYPVDRAARVAAEVVRERAWALEEIRFVLFTNAILATFRTALAASGGPR